MSLLNLQNHNIIHYLLKNSLVLRNTNTLDLFGFDIIFEKINSPQSGGSPIEDESDQENMFFIKFIHLKIPTVHSGPCTVNKNTIIGIFLKMFDLAIILYSKNNRNEF